MEPEQPKVFPLDDDYVVLKPLSLRSPVYLCRERASDRILVLKLFSPAQIPLFQSELQALQKLEGSGRSPQLYFALQRQNWRVLGMQWLKGISLLDGRSSWNPVEKTEIAEELNSALRELHEVHHLAHLDLSPRNVLMHRDSRTWRATFVDWEAACNLTNPHLSDFNLRGTTGFMDDSEEKSLPERDRAALDRCLEYLGAIARPQPQAEHKGWRLPWT